MEQQRNILFILFLTLTLFIYWAWERDQVVSEQQAQLQAQRIEQMAAAAESQGIGGKNITLQSDNLLLTISTEGGDIIDAKLLKVLQEQGKTDPFHLLMTEPLFVYQAQSGLIGANGPDAVSRPLYTTSADSFTLKDGEDEVSAILSFEQNGVTYTKTYTLKRDSYVVDVKYDVVNSTDSSWWQEPIVAAPTQLLMSAMRRTPLKT